ncbi:MFS-type transporter SLC18B1-like [Glandiceps talaboti]
MEIPSNANKYGSVQTEETISGIDDTLDNNSAGENKGGLTKLQRITLLSMAMANLGNTASYSIMAPFFPIKASEMGASDLIIGIIFGIYAFIGFVSSPVLGKLVPKIGARFMLLSGSFTCGCCGIIFGFSDRLSPGTQFLVFCFVMRSVEALGAAASATAISTLTAQTFPDNLAVAFGILEISIGLGLMIGPPLGGILYSIGGYTLPFVVLGTFVLVILVFNFLVLPSQTGDSIPELGSTLQLLSIPSIWVTSACVVVGAMTVGFLDGTLSKHLQKFHLGTTEVGLIFFGFAISYSISTFLFGWITDKKNIPKLLMIIGNIGIAGAFMYLGPSPLLMIETSELWLTIVSLVLLGVTVGCAFVPTFLDLITTASWHGMPDNLGTHGVISGLFNALFNLGGFVGPSAGGALVGHFGFQWAASIFAMIYLLLAFVMIVFCLWEYQCGKGRRIPKAKVGEEEMELMGIQENGHQNYIDE